MKTCQSKGHQTLWNAFNVYIKQNKSLDVHKLLLTVTTLGCIQDYRIYGTNYLKMRYRQHNLRMGQQFKVVLSLLPLKVLFLKMTLKVL